MPHLLDLMYRKSISELIKTILKDFDMRTVSHLCDK